MLKLSHINARSVCNKILSLHHSICENNIDICAVSETWIKQDDDHNQKGISTPKDTRSSAILNQTDMLGEVWPSY